MSGRGSTFLSVGLLVALLGWVPATLGHDIWHVDDDALSDPEPNDPNNSDPLEDGSAAHPFDAIQEAIDASSNGDLVLVYDGVYSGDGNKNIDFGGRAIMLWADNGPDACIIDCGGTGAAVKFISGESRAALVDGFTMRNGKLGIRVDGADPTIRNCIIVDNNTWETGAGIQCIDGSPVIANCAIAGNTSKNQGGGIYCENSTLLLASCLITHNWTRGTAGGDGGGIYALGSDLTVVNCVITANTSNECDGGGIALADSTAFIGNCIIAANAARYAGDAIVRFTATEVTLVNSIVWGNGTKTWPIWLWEYGDDERLLDISFCNLEGYHAAARPDFLRWGPGNMEVDPAFADADGPDDDPNTWEDNDWRPTAIACIDAGSNAALTADVADLDYDGDTDEPIPLDFVGLSRVVDAPGAPDVLPGGSGIVDIGPYEASADWPLVVPALREIELFVIEGQASTAQQIVTLQNAGGGSTSWSLGGECAWLSADPNNGTIDADAVDVLVTADVAGLGYGEHACTLTLSAPGAVNAEVAIPVMVCVTREFRVPDEYATIQAAIDATVVTGDAVIVADGTYTGEGNRALDFDGKSITVRSENGPEACIIDCELEKRAFFFASGETAHARVDGLTIQNAPGAYGALYIKSGSNPTITNCVITGVDAAAYGGAIFCKGPVSPTIMNCRVYGNDLPAVYLDGQLYPPYPRIIGCEFWDNHLGVFSYHDGCPIIDGCLIRENCSWGIMCTDGGIPLIVNSTIARNGEGASQAGGISLDVHTATVAGCTITQNYGYGISASGATSLAEMTVSDCQITENHGSFGGGIGVGDVSLSARNCTISGNTGHPTWGGAVACGSGVITISNSTLWSNGDQEISVGRDTQLSVSYCDIRGGWDGVENIDEDPLFVDPDGADDDPNTWEDNDYRFALDSPCVDSGDNTLVAFDIADVDGDGNTAERTPTDAFGGARFVDVFITPDAGVADSPAYPDIVDRGAHEAAFCFGDFDGDGQVGLFDLAHFLGHYGMANPTYYDGDLDLDGDVDVQDLAALLGAWGSACP